MLNFRITFLLLFGIALLLAACGADASPAAKTGSSSIPASTEAAPSATPAASPTSASTEASPTATIAATPTSAKPDAVGRDIIELGISMYLLVDDASNPDPSLSTKRSSEELLSILESMNAIWAQAGIRLTPKAIVTLEVPEDILRSLQEGDLFSFLRRLGRGVDLPGAALINGFYTREVGGPNGITTSGTGTFFVMDRPSVFDHRVSSHEVGHILGLRHTLDDPGRLLYPGTNGMRLTQEEVEVARRVAQELIRPRTEP